MTADNSETVTALTALRESGAVGPAQADAFARMLESDAFAFGRMTLTEQRDRSREAAEQAASAFVSAALNGDVGDPMRAFYRLGVLCHTRDLPLYALTILLANVLDADTARDFAVDAWRIPEWPEANGGTDGWRAVWQSVGFCSDEENVTRPTEPLTLWRGALPARKRGMAWTADRDTGLWFARRFGGNIHGGARPRLYTATVTPDRVYARLTGRGENEWIIDTRSLPIRTEETP